MDSNNDGKKSGKVASKSRSRKANGSKNTNPRNAKPQTSFLAGSPWFWDDQLPGSDAYTEKSLWKWLVFMGMPLQICFLLTDWLVSTSWSVNILFSPSYGALGLQTLLYALDVFFRTRPRGEQGLNSKRASEKRGFISGCMLGWIILYADIKSTDNANEKYFLIALTVLLVLDAVIVQRARYMAVENKYRTQYAQIALVELDPSADSML